MKLLPFESEIGKQFREVVRGNNFITPYFVGYINTKKGICEISKGRIITVELFGVTVINCGVEDNELSKCLNSMIEVEEYINELDYEDYSYLENSLKEISN